MSIFQTIERQPLIENKRIKTTIIQSIRSLFFVIYILIIFSFTCFIILFFTTNSPYILPPTTLKELSSQLRDFENEIITFQQNLEENKKDFLREDIILIKSLAPKFEQPIGDKTQDYKYLKSTLSNFSQKFEEFLNENPELIGEAGVICGKKDLIFAMALDLEEKRV